MAEYRNKKELKGHVLNIDDKLYFTVKDNVLEYEVSYSRLMGKNVTHDLIFKALSIDSDLAFCSNAYGYKPESGLFPWCKFGDIEALTRVALALFEECEKQSSVQSPKEEVTIPMECPNKKPPVVGDIIYSYKDIDIICDDGEQIPCYNTTFKVGDKVIADGEETVILGFSNFKENLILTYKKYGYFANNNYIYTHDGIPIKLTAPRGWFYKFSEIIPINSQEEPTTTSNTEGEVILRYKDAIVTRTSKKRSKCFSYPFKFAIGDKVLYNNEETVVLGYRWNNSYVIYRPYHDGSPMYDQNGYLLSLNGEYGYFVTDDCLTSIPDVATSTPKNEEDKTLLVNYKGTNVYCETTPSLPSLEDTFKYSIGDTVLYNGKETRILGIGRELNNYLIWKDNSHDAISCAGVCPQTLSGCKITISTKNGWWAAEEELSPISKESSILMSYKDVDVCYTGESSEPLSWSPKFKIGDRVTVKGEETCILGFGNIKQCYLIYKKDASHFGDSAKTLLGDYIVLSKKRGTWVSEKSCIILNSDVLLNSQSIDRLPSYPNQSYQINSSEEEFQIHITKKQYHI